MAVQADHAALENGKEANRPRPNDDDVGLLRVSWAMVTNWPSCCANERPLAAPQERRTRAGDGSWRRPLPQKRTSKDFAAPSGSHRSWRVHTAAPVPAKAKVAHTAVVREFKGSVSLMFGPAYFLSGDSFLKRTAVEDAARQRLAPVFSKWIGREEIKVRSEEMPSRLDVSERVALLEKMVPAHGEAGQEVLIGRSSGGRVATVFAMRRPVKAVICFAYPLKHPNSVLEPIRFSHLAHITVPTLIFQGNAGCLPRQSTSPKTTRSRRQ